MRVLSVDLGTSNTVAVLSAHGRPPRVVEVDGSATMPSAVFAAEDGTLLVGRDAERRARLDPARFEPNPKRRVDEGTLLLGDTVVSVTDALGAVFRRVTEETVRQLGGARPDEVRLTHPAQWGPVRRTVLLAAARLGGMGANLVLVPEPVAAAAHFASFPGHSLPPGGALAVYDLGAGTFDCAIVGASQSGFAVLAEDGLADLGGLDVDQALLEHVGRQVSYRDPTRWQRLLRPESTGDRRAQRTLREDVKEAKEALSRHPQTEVPMPEPFEDVLVTRAELEALIRPSMLRSVELLAATARSTGIHPGSLVGIYLVGGSSRIPLVANLIGDQLRIVPTSLDQPETAVALGAHDVPADGVSMRTQDLPSQFGRPQQVPPPVQQQPPHQTPAYPASGPFPAFTPGPFTQYGGVQAAQRTGNRKRRGLLIGISSLVVLVLAVAAGVFLTNRGPSLPTAQDCRQSAAKDSAGFTACLRQLAGVVPDHGKCEAGNKGANALFASVSGPSVSCVLGGGENTYNVVYTQSSSSAVVQQVVTALGDTTKGDKVEADWKGNGLSGRYQSSVQDGVGLLVFTVRDRPLFGVVVRTVLDAGTTFTADTLASYFEKNIEPGT